MQDEIRLKVIDRLKLDYGLVPRPGTNYMRGGKCPSCGKKELYTSHEKPWVVRCGRQAKCGRELHVKDLYDDLFDDWSKRFTQTPSTPNAAADAYLEYNRGFDLKDLRGLYTQETYYDRKLQLGTATVRFALHKGGYWERLIDRPHRFGKQKARFMPGQSFAGVWWCAASVEAQLDTISELWVVEGIFHAIAHLQHGNAAVAAMSNNQFPEESLRALAKRRAGHLPTLIWALDTEPVTRDYIRKHVRRAEAMGFRCRAAQIVQREGRKTDWDDLHLRALALSDPAERDKQWAHDVAEARYQGDLLLAKSATEKGLLMHDHDSRSQFHLEHRSRLYWFEFDKVRFDKLMQEEAKTKNVNKDEFDDDDADRFRRAAASVHEIANCYFEALYFQRNPLTDESWYFFRVDFPHDHPSVKGTFTASQTLNAPTFRDRLASFAQGAVFDGSAAQLIHVMKDQLFNIKSVETIDFLGYSKGHRAYLLGDMAVRDGELVQANAEDFFEFDKLRVKSMQKSIALQLQRDAEEYREDWLPWLWTCFGTHGVVALTFWFGSLFAEQIRAGHKSFPFLEATGEAGAGKTTLLTFLWKLLGRQDYEGFDPAKSSVAGRSRAMGQVANMPVVLLEADRSQPDKQHAKSFDWDELKDFFGGGTLRTRGVKNGGNETYEPPFRGTIVISQNAAVDASEAILTRIVKLHFKRPNVTTESREAADNLNALPVESLSYFLLKAVRAESQVMAKFDERARVYEAALREKKDIRIERVIKNHAQMLALLDCLRLVVPLTAEMVETTRQALVDMALERQRAISADNPLVAEFWEVYEYLEGLSDTAVVNHSRDENRIAINLNEFAALAAKHSQKLADLNVLRELLRNSRRHKFVDANVAVNSVIRSRATVGPGAQFKAPPLIIKCWTFQK
ncbi:toprim domain-containing protein [Lysobacter cavernae]|uniref:Toprim domain-containing protein n=1 Tax=Lysobacter cavernae TaxID=1685901 RepID=A0ABV7RMM1_9GAMM